MWRGAVFACVSIHPWKVRRARAAQAPGAEGLEKSTGVSQHNIVLLYVPFIGGSHTKGTFIAQDNI